ncbi:signal recognition particle protein [Alphaproteobacteria bacterium]|jgi:signal recognition particle subunit SRP54|nr:signal recognition particle protein [Alphaproteobacteria bacterium]
MFEGLSEKLGSVFDRLRGRGALTEADVDTALREVRLALIEADVALSVIKAFMTVVREKAVGSDVLKSVTPGQMVVKIVNDALIDMLGPDDAPLNLNATPPAVILMVGLQGSGKTTTAGKLARQLFKKDKKSVMLASLDVTRPAAREQLRLLGEEAGVGILPEQDNETPVAIAKRAMQAAKLKSADVLILDTAGRTTVDAALMAEAQDIAKLTKPVEILLVADAMTGQDAVTTATAFNEAMDVTGIILTRADGDQRGGAALSMRHVTGCPIKFLGVGEKQDALEQFSADRMAGRILGMGDVVGLVEKAAENIEAEEAERMAKRMAKGQFDMTDFLSQLKQLKKMGGMGGLLGMLPGIGKMQKAIKAAGIDDNYFNKQEAIILSMNKRERRQVALLNASRRKRIAEGSGTSVQDVNKLVKQYQDMAKMMKRLGKGGGGDPAALASMFGGGAPGGDAGASGLPPGEMPDLSKLGGMPGLGGGMPGLGKGGFPGLGGMSRLGGKKKKR